MSGTVVVAAPPSLAYRACIPLAWAGVLCQVAYPLTPTDARARLAIAIVLLLAAAAAAHAYAVRGAAWTVRFLGAAVGVSFAAEVVGVATGVPFGTYAYADSLGPTLLGVPLLVPLAWTMAAYPAYVAARRVVPDHRAARVAVAAWALASWDLFLDPQMVAAGHWAWEDSGAALPGLDGIPAQNFLGWLVVSALIMTLVELSGSQAPPVRGPSQRSDALPYAIFLWTWLSGALAAAAFFGTPGAAVWGGLALGLVALPLVAVLVRDARERR